MMTVPYLLDREDLRPRPSFAEWASNTHSQCGEDGIIAHILGALKIASGYFIEFGAWDGRHLSNCASLADRGFSGCFIEADASRHADLVKEYAERSDIACVRALVQSRGPESLDAILDRLGTPGEVAVLSIDIDGTDYHVWAGFESRKPAVVIVEYNATVPANVVFAQADDPSIHQGCSLAALHRLGLAKGYVLAAATDVNGIFVRADLCEAAGLPSYRPHEIQPTTFETAMFHGYDGTVFSSGYGQLVWHGVPFDAEKLQVLPEPLRKFPIGQTDEYYRMIAALRPAPRSQ